MFKFGKKDKQTKLEKEIERVVESLKELSPNSAEYAEASKNLKTLHEAKSLNKLNFISKDTLVTAGVSLLSVLIIVGHESVSSITSKAVNFVIKGRV
jgi:hypothetical protein